MQDRAASSRTGREQVDTADTRLTQPAKPIIFSAPMVRAILDGRKTQTRRVLKPQPHIDAMGNLCVENHCYGQTTQGEPCLWNPAFPLRPRRPALGAGGIHYWMAG